MEKEQLHELLYQALETELGGVQVYTTTLRGQRRLERGMATIPRINTPS